MARSRNIKPGLFANAELAECSIWARYLFALLPTIADREGRLEDRPKQIKGELLRFDSQDVEPLLAELAERRFVIRYQNPAGQWIQITKFWKHQTPHYSERKSVIKPPSLQEWPEHERAQGAGKRCDEEVSSPGELQERSKSSSPIKAGAQPPDSLIPDSLIPELKAMSGSPPDGATPEIQDSGKKLNGHAYLSDAESVLTYLNRATGHAYRFRSPAGKLTPNADVIIGRLKEGYSAEQLREVVLAKAGQWRGDEKMAQFLRPETLFGKKKFATYLGELGEGVTS